VCNQKGSCWYIATTFVFKVFCTWSLILSEASCIIYYCLLLNSTNSLSLAQACTSGNVEAVRTLVSQGNDVNASTEDGESLLSIAASSGFYEICEVVTVTSFY
jgi:ankyrin repeat protein